MGHLQVLLILVNSRFRDKSKSNIPDAKRVGLARALSKMGYCSRTQAEKFVREGKVRLNGTVSRNPEALVRMGKDRVEVEGRAVQRAPKIYLVMNKPRGLVTTVSDERGRPTVYSLLPEDLRWVAPVGRLDMASEGLLLFTNDSDWAARITDPESHLDKTYHVHIGRRVDERTLETLKRGVETPQGEVLRCKDVRLLRAGEKNCWLEMVLDEGKNRQIRRMMDGVGAEVLRLMRVAIGPLALSDLAKGAYRALRSEEKMALDREMVRRKGKA
ncbi:MAG TPA: pseudouridine synthase [Dongiaceae bacterium]|nr:pseudouridine synthase [Dongiaceae bacterium]